MSPSANSGPKSSIDSSPISESSNMAPLASDGTTTNDRGENAASSETIPPKPVQLTSSQSETNKYNLRDTTTRMMHQRERLHQQLHREDLENEEEFETESEKESHGGASPATTLEASSRKSTNKASIPTRTRSKLHPHQFRDLFQENYSIKELFQCFKEKTLNHLVIRVIEYTDGRYSRINSKRGEMLKSPEKHSSASKSPATSSAPSPSPNNKQPDAYDHVRKQSTSDKISFLNKQAWHFGCELFVSRVVLSEHITQDLFDHLKSLPQTKHHFDSIIDFQDELLHRAQIREIINEASSIPAFLNYLSRDLLDKLCKEMDFKEESQDKKEVIDSLMEEILLLGLRQMLNLLSADILKKEVYPEMVDIPARQTTPSARYLSKKETVADILGLCFPYYTLEYKQRIVEAKKNRPALDVNISKSDMMKHYTSAELSSFCKKNALAMGGAKADRAQRIWDHFSSERAEEEEEEEEESQKQEERSTKDESDASSDGSSEDEDMDRGEPKTQTTPREAEEKDTADQEPQPRPSTTRRTRRKVIRRRNTPAPSNVSPPKTRSQTRKTRRTPIRVRKRKHEETESSEEEKTEVKKKTTPRKTRKRRRVRL